MKKHYTCARRKIHAHVAYRLVDIYHSIGIYYIDTVRDYPGHYNAPLFMDLAMGDIPGERNIET